MSAATAADPAEVARRIAALGRPAPGAPAWLAGISGIDASGKGWVARRVAESLEAHGLRTALLHLDDWQEAPEVRLSPVDPPGHFYRNAFRFGRVFGELVEPLRRARSIAIEAEQVDSWSGTPLRRRYAFEAVDVVLLEGVFIFRRDLRLRFDLAVWVDCPWERALERALARGQEGLPPAETIRDYRTIYFPAQRLHEALDRPREAADLILDNA